jgi:hypothetical protein
MCRWPTSPRRRSTSVDDLAVTSANGLQLEGLDVATRLFGLPAPVTRTPQRVTWRRLQFAEFAAGAGEAEWQLGPGYEVTATARQRLADGIGSLELTGLRAAPGVARFPAEIAFEQVSLQELLELLSKGKVTGEGRISGDVAVVVHTKPRLAIDIQGGRLAAAPGGLVRFLDDQETEEMIREHAKQIAASTGHDSLVQERIVGALKEFAYSTLDFRLQPEPDGKGVTLNVHAAGKGRKVPQELDLTVNLHGFDTALDTALAIKFGLDRARRSLGEKLGESTDDKAADPPAGKDAGKDGGDDESPDRPNGQRKP